MQRDESPDADGLRLDTRYTRATAAILVANSHLEHFYSPSWLAGDGLLGNSLFFLLAGYGLGQSRNEIHQPFSSWYLRRAIRLYPATWITLGIAFIIGLRGADEADISGFLWPTKYTFIEFVLPLYVFLFPLLALRSRTIVLVLAVVWLSYIFFYAIDVATLVSGSKLALGQRPAMIHATAYFSVMVFGLLLSRMRSMPNARSTWAALFLVALWYVIIKALMVNGYGARAYAVLHASVFVLSALWLVALSHPGFLNWTSLNTRWLDSGAAWLGALTLEIYVVHVIVVENLQIESALLGHLVFWPLTAVLAFALSRAALPVQSLMLSRLRLSNAGTSHGHGTGGS